MEALLVPLIALGGMAMAENSSKRRRAAEHAEQAEAFALQLPALEDPLAEAPAPESSRFLAPFPTLDERFPQRRKTGTAWNGYGDAYLDNAIGQGSLFTHKKEHASMFAPSPQDRVNASEYTEKMERERAAEAILSSNRQEGVRPFEPIQTRGNIPDPLMNRIAEPTVDDLRSSARPKPEPASMDGFQGPARGIQVPALTPEHVMLKMTPETFYENNPEQWMVTTGAVIAPASYASEVHIDRRTARETYADAPYAGHAASTTTKYAEAAHYEPSSRIEATENQRASGVLGRSDNSAGYLAPITKPRETPRLRAPPIMALVGAIGSFVAPAINLVRENRAPEESLRPYGQTAGLSGAVVSVIPEAPAGPAPTKRDLLPQNTHLFIDRVGQNGGGGAGYLIEQQNLRMPQTERSLTAQQTYFGIGSSGAAPLASTPYSRSIPLDAVRNNVRAVTATAARIPSGKGVSSVRPEFAGALFKPDIQQNTRAPTPHGRSAPPSIEAAGQFRLRPDASMSTRLDPDLYINEDIRNNPMLLNRGVPPL